jgi:hypothetical protein
MLSMIAQSFGVPSKAISTMLGTIQKMKFYLRTGFGDLEGHVAVPESRPHQDPGDYAG